jgi:Ethylbenzene dehydrogenase
MKRRLTSFAAAAAALFAIPAAHAAGINWASVPGKPVVLFYPGQSSWEWALSPGEMSGSDDFRKGKDCATCHIGEEKDMGPQIVTGQPRTFKTGVKPPIEPTPIPGKPGAINATVKVANDGTNLYVHLDFAEGAQPDARQDPNYATKVTVMFNNGHVPEANRGGCFAACHDDSTGMPSAGGAQRQMYLPKSRAKLTRQGGGDAMAGADQVAQLKANGYQLEFWQALLNPGQPAKPGAEVVLDKRQPVSEPVTADATYAGGTWSVTIARPLNAPAPFTAIAPGGTYYLAFAIHSGHTAHRFHYLSYERTMALNSGNADLVAVKQ